MLLKIIYTISLYAHNNFCVCAMCMSFQIDNCSETILLELCRTAKAQNFFHDVTFVKKFLEYFRWKQIIYCEP